MKSAETLEEFYKRKFDWVPQVLRQEMGHFDLFRLEPIENNQRPSLPYRIRDYYKVMLCIGGVEFDYADKKVEIQNQALVFSNPQIPYKVDKLDRIRGGFYCVFNEKFFGEYGDITKYDVFKPKDKHIYELSDEEARTVAMVYKKMFEEFNSNYIHKYDVLRNLVFELLHFALKSKSSTDIQNQPINASQRIASLFMELLERQFPIDENHTKIKLRTASDFAKQLNVHVNHLNRSLKEITNKSTSTIIADRLLQEAKTLLSSSQLNISEIAYSLGFTEATHFNNFFKKQLDMTPTHFRKSIQPLV